MSFGMDWTISESIVTTVDDVSSSGKDKAEHDANRHNLMKVPQRHDLVAKLDITKIETDSVCRTSLRRRRSIP